jgi:hypothetical protein
MKSTELPYRFVFLEMPVFASDVFASGDSFFHGGSQAKILVHRHYPWLEG